MGRTKTFDIEKALGSATEVFCKEGYKNSSMQKLLLAMEIREGSFYNAFKSKQNLYLLCLNKYNHKLQLDMENCFNNQNPVQVNLAAFFKNILDGLIQNASKQSCLMSNSLSVDVLTDQALRKCVIEETRNFVNSFKKILQASIDNNELVKNFEVEATAEILVTYIHGLNKMGLTGISVNSSIQQTTYFLKKLDLV